MGLLAKYDKSQVRPLTYKFTLAILAAMVSAYITIIFMLLAFDLPLLLAGAIFPLNDAYEDTPPLKKYGMIFGPNSWPIIAFCCVILPSLSFALSRDYFTQQFGIMLFGAGFAYFVSTWWMPDSDFYILGTTAGLVASTVFGRCSQSIWANRD